MLKSMDFSLLATKPSPKTTNILLLLSLVVSILCSIIMNPIEAFLVEKSGYGVLDLEFMWNPNEASIILDAWGEDGIQKEILVTYYDMIFLVAYSTLTATVALRNVRTYSTLRKIDPSRQQKLFYITLLPFIAAGFDLIENINLLIVLTNPQSIHLINTFLASFCATIKFLILGITIVAVLVIFFGNLLFKMRKT